MPWSRSCASRIVDTIHATLRRDHGEVSTELWEELKALEVGVVGGFARGAMPGDHAVALLSAVGINVKSRIRYARVMGLKEETVQAIGFKRLVIFRPGIIGGNVHTPGYVAWRHFLRRPSPRA